MRIGLEMFGTQTESRHRGIGRYCRNLASALLPLGPSRGHEFVLYAAEHLPTDLIPSAPNAPLRLLAPKPTLRESLTRVIHDNPDDLDVLAILNPIDLYPGCDLPAQPPRGRGPRLAAVAYDLIPLIFPNDYLRDWPGTLVARRYTMGLDRLRDYDQILAISEATRADLIQLLNVPPERVDAIGAAGDDHAGAFTPDADDPETLRALGLDGPFVFSVAATDPRKNLAGLLDAFGRLPADLRAGYKLAVTVRLSADQEAAVRAQADSHGITSSLVLTGPVSDRTLAALYRRAAAFVFPSLYEGFGLPILEAFQCGAAVLAGDNSAQPEVAGDAALLVDASRPSAIAEGLKRLLTDSDLAVRLRTRGPARARAFSWERVATRMLDALAARRAAEPVAKPVTATATAPGPLRKRRLALVGPLPPDPSESARATEALVQTLSRRDRLDVFHDARACPPARFAHREVGFHDHRLFARFDRVRPYDGVVYVMGPSPDHAFVAETAKLRPGLILRPEDISCMS